MNIYVSNLSFHTNEEDLKTLFSQFGVVTSVKIILDKITQRSRGFGFVEMTSGDDGNAAINGLNGRDIEGRSLAVSVAREREERSSNYSRRY